MNKRGSGVLLHISSLPSEYGIGDFGPEAFTFVDMLAGAQQRYWQILPLNPTSAVNGNSPYSSASAFAGNPLFISPRVLINEGLVTDAETEALRRLSPERVDYDAVYALKAQMLDHAYARFVQRAHRHEFEDFCRQHNSWLDDYALFLVLKEQFHHAAWSEWPTEYRDRQPQVLQQARARFAEAIARVKFAQFIFFKQWRSLKEHCGRKQVAIVGDIPIYVTYDSVDVWTSPQVFQLNADKSLMFLAGVPPDYFSATGQLWGNPVYNWDVLRDQNYAWWIERVRHNLALFDVVRIDHFRGFVDFWQVPRGESTAINGWWMKAPAREFFTVLLNAFPGMPIIAEDLGIITDEVREIMRSFGFPGMKIIMFAFGEDKPTHPYLPHNYDRNCVAYTGTHDNNTLQGWFAQEVSAQDRERIFAYVGREVPAPQLYQEMIRLVLASVAAIAIIPLQDVLGYGAEQRMNVPGKAHGNWQWRITPQALHADAFDFLKTLTIRYARI